MTTLDGAVLAWVRTRTQPNLLLTAGGSPTLSRQDSYLSAFTDGSDHAGWRRPWIGDDSYNYYWARNLGQNYRAATANRAWKRQVPLRDATPPVLTTSLDSVSLSCDRFIFPCGTGVVITAEVSGPLDAAGLVGLAARLAGAPVIGAPGSAEPSALAAVIGDVLDGLEEQVLGAADPGAVGEIKPTTIAAVTATSGWPSAPVVQADPVHRLLEGLCRMTAAPLSGSVGDLASALVDAARDHPDTVRLCVGAGRAVWSPDQSATPDGSRKLNCYHQNLVMASLQCQVLLDAVQWAAAQPGGSFSEDVKILLRPVVNVLGLLYGKVDDMYASNFVRRQIDSSGLVPDIGNLRIALGVGGPLS